MDKLLLVIAVAWLIPAAAAPESGARGSVSPHIYLSYSGIFDQVCSSIQDKTVDPLLQQEAIDRLPEFQKAWDQNADTLMQSLFSIAGKSFPHVEMRATLTVCNFVSISDPLIINVRGFLETWTPETLPSPMHGFVDLLFHEFIHNFLVENFDWRRSKLLYKYREESQGVRAHLHLMAVQKAVYLQTERPEFLQWAEHMYKDLIGGDYARAWTIVNDLEDHRDFLKEL